MRKRKPGVVVVDKEIILSEAYLSLSGKAPQIYLIFLGKRRIGKIAVGRKKVPVVLNNGEIIFTYQEAEKLGISRQAFARALDQLIECGFIDIAHTGVGLYKSATFYSISERWKRFGTPDFEYKERKKRRQNFGFQKDHPVYRKHK